MATFTSPSPEETFRLGRELGRRAGPGWVFGLIGPLGAGKTQLVKGIAQGLGVPSRIQSPTFALVLLHTGGRLPLAHVDLYRLDTAEQILGAGLEEYLHPRDSVTVVEWYDRWPGPHPARLCPVHLRATSETERTIDYDPPGP